MDLRSSSPYWLLRHGIVNSYPSLHADIKVDVAIMGGGISGALVAWELSKTEFSVALFDRRHIGSGSTAASTALLQYEIDTPLHQLIHLVGEKNAVASYKLCLKAIHDLGSICNQLKDPGLFKYRPSLQFASFSKDVAKLKEEYNLRKANGFELQWLDDQQVRDKFRFNKPSAILSKYGAEADAYYITHRLLERALQRGTGVYDNTEIVSIKHHKRHVELLTAEGFKVIAKKLIIACGYESEKYLPHKVQKLQSTYAIVSEPCDSNDFWYRNALIWETATPYIYMRATDDKRILMGGKDDDFSGAARRDHQLAMKARQLENTFAGLFPHIPFKTDFKWAGAFASTKDGLPYIGSVPQRPNTYFALGFGGNGITFSVIAARMIRRALEGKKNKEMDIFSFDR